MANAILTKADQLARSKVGYREGPRNNETMFGAWFGMNFQPWCAIFLSWISFNSGLTYLGKPWRFASTISARDHAKRNNRWITVPTVGTFAMMAHSATTGHIGYVIALLRRNGVLIVVTIEGNTNDQGAREGNGVWIRERSVSSWDGYIVLDQTYAQDQPQEEDLMLHYYRIRDESNISQPHPTLGSAVWISDGINTNWLSDPQFTHGRNMGWYDKNAPIEMVPESFHKALVETSAGGNLGGPSIVSILQEIRRQLQDPALHGGTGRLSLESIDAITKSVLDAQHKRLEA